MGTQLMHSVFHPTNNTTTSSSPAPTSLAYEGLYALLLGPSLVSSHLWQEGGSAFAVEHWVNKVNDEAMPTNLPVLPAGSLLKGAQK